MSIIQATRNGELPSISIDLTAHFVSLSSTIAELSSCFGFRDCNFSRAEIAELYDPDVTVGFGQYIRNHLGFSEAEGKKLAEEDAVAYQLRRAEAEMNSFKNFLAER